MKKLFCLFCVAMVVTCVFCGSVLAETEMLPAGAKVTAIIAGDIATVTISGVTPTMVEVYEYKKPVFLGAVSTFKIDLSRGYRFNFKFGTANTYVLLTPEMKSRLPNFIGTGVDIDCTNESGCCFKIANQ